MPLDPTTVATVVTTMGVWLVPLVAPSQRVDSVRDHVDAKIGRLDAKLNAILLHLAGASHLAKREVKA